MTRSQRSAWRLGGLAVLYLLRLAAAPPSTMAGARRALLNATPLPALTVLDQPKAAVGGTNVDPVGLTAPRSDSSSCKPGRCRCPEQRMDSASAPGGPGVGEPRERRDGTKTARFLSLVSQQYGPLGDLDLAKVSRIAAELAPQAGLHAGSARSALRAAVLAARAEPDGDASGQSPAAASRYPPRAMVRRRWPLPRLMRPATPRTCRMPGLPALKRRSASEGALAAGRQ